MFTPSTPLSFKASHSGVVLKINLGVRCRPDISKSKTMSNDVTTSNQLVTKIEHKIGLRLTGNADAECCSSKLKAKYS